MRQDYMFCLFFKKDVYNIVEVTIMKKLSKNALLLGSLFLISGCNQEPVETNYIVNFYVGNEIVSSQTVKENGTITKPTIEGTNYVWRVGNLEDRYWNFDGYFADRVNGDINLYATTLYKITLDANGGACIASDLTVEVGKNYSLPLPQKAASTFLGWFDSDGRLFDQSGQWSLTSDITLTARYVITNRMFNLNAGPGQCSENSVFIPFGGSYHLPTPTTTQKDEDWDYVFDYWKFNDKKIDNEGSNWDYVGEDAEFVAVYKLKESKDYLDTKYSFELNNAEDGYIITSATSGLQLAYVPATYNGKPIVAIGDDVFKDSSTLDKVILSENLVSIGKYAFSNCDNLVEVFLPNTVETIGEGIFCDCSSLTTVILSEKITAIPACAFQFCRRFHYSSDQVYTSLENIETIGDNAFAYCEAILDLKFGDKLTSIGEGAFKNCTNLGGDEGYVLEIPDSVLTIGEEAFNYCHSLKGLKLSSSLTRIEKHAFFGLKIEELVVPEGVTYIGEEAFASCTEITSIVIPSTCKVIDIRAFHDCPKIVSLVLQEGLETLGIQAFGMVPNLTHVSIPSSLKELGNGNFAYANNLEYTEYEGCYYLGNEQNPYHVLKKVIDTNITELKIHKDTKIIGTAAFQNCFKFKTIEVPESIVDIGNLAFANCVGVEKIKVLGSPRLGIGVFRNGSVLKEVEFAPGIKEISEQTFSGCPKLEKVTLPNTVKKIGPQAFGGCTALKYITIPSSIEEIDNGAFYSAGLYYVYIPSNVTTIEGRPFDRCNVSKFFCEASSKPEGWSDDWAVNQNDSGMIDWSYGNIVIDGISYVRMNNEFYVEKLLNLWIENVRVEKTINGLPVTKIREHAFQGGKFTTCILPQGLITIGKDAFHDCKNMHSIIIPSTVTTIEGKAFMDDPKLATITIPASVVTMEDQVFANDDITIYMQTQNIPAGWDDDWSLNCFEPNIIYSENVCYDFGGVHYEVYGDNCFSVEVEETSSLTEFNLLETIDGKDVKIINYVKPCFFST